MSLFGADWEYSGERPIGATPGYEHRWFSETADGNWIVARVTTETQGLSEEQALELYRESIRG